MEVTTTTSRPFRRFTSWISWITVEPVEFLYVLMFTISNVVRDNLILDKMCLLDLKCDPEVCYNLTHGVKIDKNISDLVQTHATSLEVYDGILMAVSYTHLTLPTIYSV